MAGRVHKAAHCPSAPTLSSGRYAVGAAVVSCGVVRASMSRTYFLESGKEYF